MNPMSTVALHQKYRPQTIAELVGQPYIKTTLTNAVKYLQIAPAYLFTGSRGTGKTSTARIFAKSVNQKVFLKGRTTSDTGDITKK